MPVLSLLLTNFANYAILNRKECDNVKNIAQADHNSNLRKRTRTRTPVWLKITIIVLVLGCLMSLLAQNAVWFLFLGVLAAPIYIIALIIAIIKKQPKTGLFVCLILSLFMIVIAPLAEEKYIRETVLEDNFSDQGVAISDLAQKLDDMFRPYNDYIEKQKNLNAQLETAKTRFDDAKVYDSKNTDNSPDSLLHGQELREACQEFSYNEIARYPEQYKDQYVKFVGKIIQVVESSVSNQIDMRLALESNDVVYISYNRQEQEPRLLEGDKIIAYGKLNGLITYESLFGQLITIPQLNMIEYDLIS